MRVAAASRMRPLAVQEQGPDPTLDEAQLFLPAWAGGGSRRPSDLATRDSGSDLDQFAADWDRPFLENGWNVAPLTNHGDNRDESLGKWLVDDVVLSNGVHP